jgi:hypothetical protein
MVILVMGLSAPIMADEPGVGIIEGSIFNKTEGGSSVVGKEAILKTYLDDTEVGSTTVITGAEGSFIFNGLSVEPGYNYQVVVFFQQAEYFGERISFGEGETAKSVEINVYDSTTSAEAISVVNAHTIIYVGQERLQVKEYYLFVNESDLTYIGSKEVGTEGDREILIFTLPSDAAQLRITLGLMECCILNYENGFSDTMPFLPGGQEVAYSYEVEYDSGRYELSQLVNYPIANFDLMLQGDVKVDMNLLDVKEPLDIGDVPFSHFAGNDLVPGDVLSIKMSDLPGSGSLWVITGVVLALVILGGGLSFGYRWKKKRVQPVILEDSIDQRRQRLLIELAHLDDDFDDGKIKEDAYRSLRNETKVKLAELIRRSHEEGNGS